MDDAGVFKLYLVKTLAILVLPQLIDVHTMPIAFRVGTKKLSGMVLTYIPGNFIQTQLYSFSF